MLRHIVLSAALLAGPAFSQEAPATSPDCDAASMAQPASDARPEADRAVEGNTGWSGGTGGSFIGTNSQGSVSHVTWHPPTARGLDLSGTPENWPDPAGGRC